MKLETEKRENKPSGMKKVFRIAFAVLGSKLSLVILLNLTLFCTKFLQFFETFQDSYCKCGFPQLKNSYEVNPQSNM